MLGFITRRTLLAIPVLIGIVIVVFFLIRLIPGDPCTALLGERATEEACERFNEANGLDEPVWTQLGIYMGNVLTFDLGESVGELPCSGQLRLRLAEPLRRGGLALARRLDLAAQPGDHDAVRGLQLVEVGQRGPVGVWWGIFGRHVGVARIARRGLVIGRSDGAEGRHRRR